METKEPKKKKVVNASVAKVKKEKVEPIAKVSKKVAHEAKAKKEVEHVHATPVTHAKKKLPPHITALSFFAMEFRKKKSSPVLTVLSLVILIGLVFLYKSSSSVDASQPSNTVVATKKEGVYSNSIYGFSFKLPTAFSQVREAPDAKACLDNQTWNYQPVTSVTVAEIQNISVVVGCQKLTDTLINQFAQEKVTTKEITLQGRKAYVHAFVTDAGYSWKILQVPVDATHYIEISHNYKPGSELVLPSDLPGYVPLSEREWNGLIASIAFK